MLSPEHVLWEAIQTLSEGGAVHTNAPTFPDMISNTVWDEQAEWEREVEAYERTEVRLCREGKVEMPC